MLRFGVRISILLRTFEKMGVRLGMQGSFPGTSRHARQTHKPAGVVSCLLRLLENLFERINSNYHLAGEAVPSFWLLLSIKVPGQIQQQQAQEREICTDAYAITNYHQRQNTFRCNYSFLLSCGGVVFPAVFGLHHLLQAVPTDKADRLAGAGYCTTAGALIAVVVLPGCDSCNEAGSTVACVCADAYSGIARTDTTHFNVP